MNKKQTAGMAMGTVIIFIMVMSVIAERKSVAVADENGNFKLITAFAELRIGGKPPFLQYNIPFGMARVNTHGAVNRVRLPAWQVGFNRDFARA
ncbi:MAG: hypothetical protein FWB96_01625 [Defluviitaleaceae bacterium]|nr:hypothetical protein [Defluviitaleaceae bacterium]MCL2261607.1 hypothetical protein [Defluviitaleaceae bacterium]